MSPCSRSWRCFGGVAPHAREAVGLQLEANGEVVLEVGTLLHRAAHLRLDAQQLLHVVADLVRQDVRLGELAGRAEASLQLVVEAEVDVDLLVERAVEGAGGGLAVAAAGLHGVAEEHQLGVLVAAVPASCARCPARRRGRTRRTGRGGPPRAWTGPGHSPPDGGPVLQDRGQREEVAPGDQGEEPEDQEPSQPDARAGAHAGAAPILEVVALSARRPAHRGRS